MRGANGESPVFAESELAWLSSSGAHSPINIEFSVGLDGLSVWLFGLSALLTFTAVLISWDSIRERPAAFYALLLLLETGMLGVFAARDIILFYIFFEFTLIPLVLPDRHLGERGAAARGREVLPVHVRRQRAHVSRTLDDRALAVLELTKPRTRRFNIQRLTAALATDLSWHDPDHH